MLRIKSHGVAKSDLVKVTFAAVAIVAALVFVVLYFNSQQGHEVGHIDTKPGSSIKLQAMKQMKEAEGKPGAGGGYSPGSLGGNQSTTSGAPAGSAAPQDGGDRSPDR